MKPLQFNSVQALEDNLSLPTPAVIQTMRQINGDLMVLGVAGKMGPTLARMAKRAMTEAGLNHRVIGVSRFSHAQERERLEQFGIDTLQGDLLDDDFVQSLPQTPAVVYMAGMKFGATGNESLTWAMNTLLPASVCKRYAQSRIAAFSTGNVYGMVSLTTGGSIESDTPNPQGEYAMSCLGRERTFEHFSRTLQTPVTLLRLNYASELRYGVLVDVAQKVWQQKPIDLTMGMVNVIWQRDANAMALCSLMQANSPPFFLNLAGPETLSIQRIALELGKRMNRTPSFTGQTSEHALLNNGQLGHQLFGYPSTSVHDMLDAVAHWIMTDGQTLGKPTKFEVRDGKF